MNSSRLMINAKRYLNEKKGRALTVEQRSDAAIELAGIMLSEAQRTQRRGEKKTQAELARMMNDPSGKAFTTSMTDQCFRTNQPARIADQLNYLIDKFGIPRFLSKDKRLGLKLFRWTSKLFPSLMVPMAKWLLRKETSKVILPGEPEKLYRYMMRRRKEGVRVNLNHLGEAILGEEEAKQRLDLYLKDLANPNVEYISVKISTICSQLNLLSWEKTLELLSEGLTKLYRAANNHVYTRPDGTKCSKFVNLDMEEYRDLTLTVDLFKRVLEDAEFYQLPAGIVLQSYLPDSFRIQKELTEWAIKRVESGGAPIKIRIVKGANLSMEYVEASLRQWTIAPYSSKGEVDANYKRMVTYGFEPRHAKAVHLGIASHNLFDIAYALILRAENGVEKFVSFEMLEGMADHIRRVVQELSGNMLLYCPAATKEEFQNAVAYLVRRLDENTAPDNFLRHAFGLRTGTHQWTEQADLFAAACRNMDNVAQSPRRKQSRLQIPVRKDLHATFENEADTDWSLPQNRKWAERIIREWSNKTHTPIPLVLGQEVVPAEGFLGKGEDPSYPKKEFYQYALGNEKELEQALEVAVDGFKVWSARPLKERSLILDEVAYQLRCKRDHLIGAMIGDAGKTLFEGDIEVSEAIDFVEYYRRNVEEAHFLSDIQWQPKGPVLVASPWNFPCSIPIGGIIASLAAGNSVIFKPAPETVLTGWVLSKILWDAGIDRRTLQFFTCRDDPIGSRLVQDPRIASVILTGATATAKRLMKLRPGLDLHAETGGKNAIIVTNLADRDLAIKNIIQSAFGHAGQKCSACSLLILESEVYEDPHFRHQLADAAASLTVGSPWDLSSQVTPLINPPGEALKRALTSLDEGEAWLLEPRCDPLNPRLWSPGIKIGVSPGSFTHTNELFGPVLAVMKADNLQQAVVLANSTPYGLTSGIQSLDEREIRYWLKHIEAGNCYVNRTITGAVVRRQPFGGCKASSFGKGAKAGGPNYVMQLMQAERRSFPKEKEPLNEDVIAFHHFVLKADVLGNRLIEWNSAIGSYSFFWNHYFAKKHDPSLLLGQDNFLYYKPYAQQTLRFQHQDNLIDVLMAIAAALTCHATLEISTSADSVSGTVLESILDNQLKTQAPITVKVETESQLIERLASQSVKRLRLLSAPTETFRNAAAEIGTYVLVTPVMVNGRLELLNYLREVAESNDYHRYGNLGEREGERRASLVNRSCGIHCRC